MKKISIVIPSYNSSSALERNLPYLMSTSKNLPYEVEVLIVDDGSNDKDKTKAIAELNNCLYYRLEQNQGKGGAVREGMQRVSGDFCIYTDADIPFETEALNRLMYYLDFKEYDLVIGDRGMKESNYFEQITSKRKWGSKFFTFIVGRFITTGVFDTQCGLKGFTRKVADDLFSVSTIKGFSFDVELIYISLKRNYDIKKIPVKLRSQDGNTVSLLRNAIKMIFEILSIKLNHLKGKYDYE